MGRKERMEVYGDMQVQGLGCTRRIMATGVEHGRKNLRLVLACIRTSPETNGGAEGLGDPMAPIEIKKGREILWLLLNWV